MNRYPGQVFLGGTSYEVKRAFVNVAAGTVDADIVAAVVGKRIFVLSLVMSVGTVATDVTFNSKPAGAGTPISPLFQNAANANIALNNTDDGWFNTESAEGLTATTGAGSAVGIMVNYIERA